MRNTACTCAGLAPRQNAAKWEYVANWPSYESLLGDVSVVAAAIAAVVSPASGFFSAVNMGLGAIKVASPERLSKTHAIIKSSADKGDDDNDDALHVFDENCSANGTCAANVVNTVVDDVEVVDDALLAARRAVCVANRCNSGASTSTNSNGAWLAAAAPRASPPNATPLVSKK